MSSKKQIRSRFYTTAVIAAILLSAVALTGCGGGGGGVPGVGSVTGRAYDTISLAGISGASVVPNVAGVGGTTTDSNGQYLLSGLPAGQVTLTVSRLGYNATQTTVTITAGGTTSRDVPLADTGPPPPPITP